MRFVLVFTSFLILSSVLLSAQETTDVPANVKTGPPITDPIKVAAEYRQILTRPAYQEIEAPGLDTRLRDWFSHWFMRFGLKFSEFKYANTLSGFAIVLFAALVLLAIVGLVYIIFRLSHRHHDLSLTVSTDLLDKKARPLQFYEDEVRQAVHNRNWHAAWRAIWRQFLSQLESHHLVEADRTRTNREYLVQLHAQSLPEAALPLLKDMVENYDQTIYGRREIDELTWTSFQQKVQEAALLLHLDGQKTALLAGRENL